MAAAQTVGVIGAGTMGAGIAQLACQAGARTILHDAFAEALERGAEQIRAGLEKNVTRGRMTREDADAAAGRLETSDDLQSLGPCDLVIEAAPELPDLKAELFKRLCGIVGETCVLATNTSSLPVTGLAAHATHPGRVVGMHFFNPAPVMKLVEVIAGEESSDEAIALAQATGEAMGKRVIRAADGPGFLVNRCGRPFGMEALRLVQDRVASVEQVDRICRMAGGFRMGPFELMDLVGVDTGYDVQRSFWDLSFGEPRWRPSTITARMVAAGRTGRKAGRGYYEYPPGPPGDPDPPAGGGGDGLVVVAGDLAIADELRDAAQRVGFDVAEFVDRDREPPWLIVDCGSAEDEEAPLQGGPRAVLCADGSLAALDPSGSAAGFHALPPFGASSLVELTRGETTSGLAAERTEAFFAALGQHTEWVGDAPGLVLGRIVCQLVNEAAFALREGVGSAEDIDAGMTLGLNHPHGPLARGDEIGLDHVLAVIDALYEEEHDPRYRACPELRRLVWEGRLGRPTGRGFFQ